MPDAPAALRILVVDDDVYLREFYACVLRSLGHQPVLAADGAEALAILNGDAEEFSLAVVDLLMPVTSGWDLLEAVRKEAKWDKLPIIAMTGLPLSGDEFDKVKRLCNEVFLKSEFELARFSAAVSRLLQH